MRNCYTYLIGWSKENKFYYGVRYARNCCPDDLWVSYFTSSKYIRQFRNLYGEPNIIQIRRTFGDNSKKAKLWEERVLCRLDVIKSKKWINQSNNFSFRNCDTSWNEGLTKQTNKSLKLVSEKMKIIRKNKKWSHSHKKTLKQKEDNSWRQITEHNPNFIFNNYQSFCDYCVEQYELSVGVYTISKNLGLDGGTIKTALKNRGIDVVCNQSWSKIKMRYPNFLFKTYEDFVIYCQNEYKNGKKRGHLKIELGLSEDAIKKALHYSLP